MRFAYGIRLALKRQMGLSHSCCLKKKQAGCVYLRYCSNDLIGLIETESKPNCAGSDRWIRRLTVVTLSETGACENGSRRCVSIVRISRFSSVERYAGDAHFQLGRVERAIQTIKRISEKLVSEFPDATGIQILAAACSAHNELRRIKGYSPNQWVLGQAKHG